MGEEEGRSFDVDKFVDSHEVDTFYKDNAVSFFDGIPLAYGRFYEDRYTKRGNDINFTSLIGMNWDQWIGDIITKSSVNKTVVILPKDGCLQAYIENIKE